MSKLNAVSVASAAGWAILGWFAAVVLCDAFGLDGFYPRGTRLIVYLVMLLLATVAAVLSMAMIVLSDDPRRWLARSSAMAAFVAGTLASAM